MSESAHAGQRIGRYVIEAPLGSGGMGQVFRAYDELLRRRVALKLLHASDTALEGAQAHEAIERILREARMAAALDHPNVVSIFDVGEFEGVAYIVMEFVLGQSLRTVDLAATDVETRIHWLADAARALGAAHRAGLVHRDVKPENVMVRNDGVVKVLDFGIARQSIDRGEGGALATGLGPHLEQLPDDLRKTVVGTMENGALVGTPGFMPPELLLHGRSDERSDQFSWAVMAYEVLTGKLPWSNPDEVAALLSAVVFETPAPLLEACPVVPPRFAAGVDRALSKDPAARFESMEQLLDAVGATSPRTLAPPPAVPGEQDAALANTAISGPAFDSVREQLKRSGPVPSAATPEAVVTHGAPERVRTAPLARALAALLLVASAGTGGAFWMRARGRNSAARARPNTIAAPAPSRQVVTFGRAERLTFDEGCEEFPSWTPDGRTVVFDAADRADYHLFALDVASGRRRTLTTGHGWQFAGAVSRDGARVAYIDRSGGDSQSMVVPFDGSSPPRRLASGGIRPTWSLDGSCVWAGSNTAALCIDPVTGDVRRRAEPPPSESIGGILDLPDGRRIARTTPNRMLSVYRLWYYGPDLRPVGHAIEGSVEEVLELSPGGRGIWISRFSTERHSQLWELPLDGGEPRAFSDADILPTKGLSLNRAATRVVWSDCATGSDVAQLVRRDGGVQAESVTPVHNWSDSEVVAIPGSELLAVESQRRGTSELWLLDRTGHAPARVVEGTQGSDGLAVSHDGRTIAFTRNADGLFIMPLDGHAPAVQITHAVGDAFASFGAGDREVYFEHTDPAFARPRVAVVSTAGGDVRFVLPAGTGRPSYDPTTGQLSYLAFSPDNHAGTVRLRDVATGRDRALSSSLEPGSYGPAAFSPDGRRIAITDFGQNAIEIDVATGTVLTRYDSGGDQVQWVTYVGDALFVSRAIWSGDLWTASVTVGTPNQPDARAARP